MTLPYKVNTHIDFTLPDGAVLHYLVKHSYLGGLSSGNAALFDMLKIEDKYSFCGRFYTTKLGYWPEFPEDDFSWIDSMIDALWDEYQVITRIDGYCRYNGVTQGDKFKITYAGETFEYKLAADASNDCIFDIMGLNKEEAVVEACGYLPCNNASGAWPETKSFPDLLKLLNYLVSKGATIKGLPNIWSTPLKAKEDKKTVSITVKKKHSITLKYN